jgi:hypothetical protein
LLGFGILVYLPISYQTSKDSTDKEENKPFKVPGGEKNKRDSKQQPEEKGPPQIDPVTPFYSNFYSNPRVAAVVPLVARRGLNSSISSRTVREGNSLKPNNYLTWRMNMSQYLRGG